VLLKNEDELLPLDLTKIRKIAVLGDDGHDKPIIGGKGSGHVTHSYIATPLEGITNRAGKDVNVTYANTL